MSALLVLVLLRDAAPFIFAFTLFGLSLRTRRDVGINLVTSAFIFLNFGVAEMVAGSSCPAVLAGVG